MPRVHYYHVSITFCIVAQLLTHYKRQPKEVEEAIKEESEEDSGMETDSREEFPQVNFLTRG